MHGMVYTTSMQRLHPMLLRKVMGTENVMHHQNGFWNAIWSDLLVETAYMQYGQFYLFRTINAIVKELIDIQYSL